MPDESSAVAGHARQENLEEETATSTPIDIKEDKRAKMYREMMEGLHNLRFPPRQPPTQDVEA